MSELDFTQITSFNKTATNIKNLTGRQFQNYLVVAYAGNRKKGWERGYTHIWLCRCINCGAWKFLTKSSVQRLSSNNNVRCRNCNPIRTLRHGYALRNNVSPEYSCYGTAKNRCSNPKDVAYARYGGRGIKFCFTSFTEFIEHLGPRPSPDYSLDRIDNNGHYEPGNVRWALKSRQQRNRSTTTILTIDGITLPLADWADRVGVPRKRIENRIRLGWCVPCAVMLPNRIATCSHK